MQATVSVLQTLGGAAAVALSALMKAEALIQWKTPESRALQIFVAVFLLLLLSVVYIAGCRPIVRLTRAEGERSLDGSGCCLARCYWKSLFQLNASRPEQRLPREQNCRGSGTEPARRQRPATLCQNPAATVLLF